ncbi:hypothetical protein A5713_14050 [Mycobacterium sp. E2497]|nr:hypothetical protein A5713_14050 [Mycobacterium sp. E2497]
MPSLKAAKIRAWIGGGDGKGFGREVFAADAQDVGLDTCCEHGDFGFEELGDPRSGVQGDAQPHLFGVGFVNAASHQEVSRRVGAVHFEAKGRGAAGLGKAHIVKHRAGVQKLQLWPRSAAVALQCNEQEGHDLFSSP